MIESAYENDGFNPQTPTRMRTQAYQAILGGSTGHVFGNNPIWHFDGPGLLLVRPVPDDLAKGARVGGLAIDECPGEGLLALSVVRDDTRYESDLRHVGRRPWPRPRRCLGGEPRVSRSRLHPVGANDSRELEAAPSSGDPHLGRSDQRCATSCPIRRDDQRDPADTGHECAVGLGLAARRPSHAPSRAPLARARMGAAWRRQVSARRLDSALRDS